MFHILYSFLLLDVYLCIPFCDNPNAFKRIVHPLRVSHLRYNNNLVYNLCSLNCCYEARHHLVVRFKTFECFEIAYLSGITCLQNKIRKKIRDFYRGQTFCLEWLLDRHQSQKSFSSYRSRTWLSRPSALFESTGILRGIFSCGSGFFSPEIFKKQSI